MRHLGLGLAALSVLALAVGGGEAAPGGTSCFFGGEEATIVGTPRADVLRGTPGRDIIEGLAGDDVILGLGGDDVICAGLGNDRANGGAGNDIVDGRRGHDRLLGGTGGDTVVGGFGNDEVRGGAGPDRLFAGPGVDRVWAGPANDIVFGHEGPDWLVLGPGNDLAFGGPSNDSMMGDPGHDRLHGEVGIDDVAGGEGGDFCVAEHRTGCEPLVAGGDLAAGTYRFDGFQPTVTVTVGDGWWSEGPLSHPEFVQVAQGPTPTYSVRLINITHVPDRVRDFTTGALVPLEGDFLTWLTSQDCIEIFSGPSPDTVFGLPATRIDFSVNGAVPCMGMYVWPGIAALWPGFSPSGYERDRLFVVEVNGVQLAVSVGTWNRADFEAFLPVAEAVLDTVQFG